MQAKVNAFIASGDELKLFTRASRFMNLRGFGVYELIQSLFRSILSLNFIETVELTTRTVIRRFSPFQFLDSKATETLFII